MSKFKKYRRVSISEMRPYEPGEKLPDSVSISQADRDAGSPKVGDMIARNPKNHDDQWLVAARYFVENFDFALDPWEPSGSDYDRSIHTNPDASAWADLFMQTFPNCGADHGTMLGWFANAMMAVEDSRQSDK